MTQHGLTSPTTPPVEVRAAKIGSRAVIAAAVIAIGAAVVGAVVGGQLTASATDRQTAGSAQSAGAELKANKERDDTSFIRGQLQTAAAKLIDDSKVANRKEHDLADMLASPTFTWKNPAYATTKHDLAVQVDLVSADTAKLQLLGYRASNSAAADVLAYHETIEEDLTSGVLSGNCVMRSTPGFTGAVDLAFADMNEYEATQGALISAVQSDLQLPAT